MCEYSSRIFGDRPVLSGCADYWYGSGRIQRAKGEEAVLYLSLPDGDENNLLVVQDDSNQIVFMLLYGDLKAVKGTFK